MKIKPTRHLNPKPETPNFKAVQGYAIQLQSIIGLLVRALYIHILNITKLLLSGGSIQATPELRNTCHEAP